MTKIGHILYLLRNAPVLEIIKALERDDFSLRKTTRTGGHIYVHHDNRRVAIHYHHASDVLKRKTLKSILEGTRWNEEDLRRLKLIK